jgi:hypothetical protein
LQSSLFKNGKIIRKQKKSKIANNWPKQNAIGIGFFVSGISVTLNGEPWAGTGNWNLEVPGFGSV